MSHTSATYTVIRRSVDSVSLATGAGEILAFGYEGPDERRAAIQCDARNCLLGEGVNPRWTVEPETDLQIEPEEVYECLIDTLAIEPADAARMLA